jgi:hypothetical protein
MGDRQFLSKLNDKNLIIVLICLAWKPVQVQKTQRSPEEIGHLPLFVSFLRFLESKTLSKHHG